MIVIISVKVISFRTVSKVLFFLFLFDFFKLCGKWLIIFWARRYFFRVIVQRFKDFIIKYFLSYFLMRQSLVSKVFIQILWGDWQTTRIYITQIDYFLVIFLSVHYQHIIHIFKLIIFFFLFLLIFLPIIIVRFF